MQTKHKKNKKYKSLHQVPGEVTYVGKKKFDSNIEVISYNKANYKQFRSNNLEDAYPYNANEQTTWVNVNGLNDTRKIENLGRHFGLHTLVLEDIVNTEQRPKIEQHGDYLFLVSKMLFYNADNEFTKEHINIILGKNYVLTFQEADEAVFSPLRERISSSKGRIRTRKADFLMYSILDAIIDYYFDIIENIGDQIQLMEDELVLRNPRKDIAKDIQFLKRKILKIRKAALPLREVIKQLESSTHPLIEQDTKNYLRDLNDHIIQVGENIEIYREMTWSLMDMYMSIISNKMNEVMKVLTIMASIFIPLTFIVGVYGMNFKYMPELDTHYGYFVVWGIMVFVTLLMIWYFKRKDWL